MISVSEKIVSRADEWAATLEPQAEAAVKAAMQRIRGGAVRGLTEHRSVATGALRRSYQAGTDAGAGTIRGWLRAEPYWQHLEAGTPPHTVPITTPEGGGLLRWVQAKKLAEVSLLDDGQIRAIGERPLQGATPGLTAIRTGKSTVAYFRDGERLGESPTFKGGRKKPIRSALERKELSIAVAVRAAIARRGTQPRPHVGPALEDEWPRLTAKLDRIYRKRG